MRALGIVLAVLLHVALLLFGGIFLLSDKEKAARVEELEEMEIEEEPEKKEEEEKEEPKDDEKIEQPAEETPLFTNELPPEETPGPALAPLSMDDLSNLLGGVGGESGFGGGSGGLSTGGVIGGSGGPGGGGAGVMNSSELDQKPRNVVRVDPKLAPQVAKTLPQVTVTVFIDASGNVMKAEVSPPVDAAAQKAILDAVLRWKYEPGMRNGKAVGSKASHKMSFSS